MLIIYNLLLFITIPIWVPWMLWRTSKRKEKPNWDEKLGGYSKTVPRKEKGEKRIWFHAVSVGEVVASLPILKEIKRLSPKTKILLSVTTSSGHSTAEEKASEFYDYLVYFPLDLARSQLFAISRVRPDVVAVMETEFWMNFLFNAKNFEAKTLLINGRVSDKSFKNGRWISWFYRSLLKYFDRCLAQSETDAQRLQQLGAPRTEVLGNCKFDQAIQPVLATPDEIRLKYGISRDEAVIVVGSTRSEFEESLVVSALTALQKEGKSFRVIHAPRHIERADDIVKVVEQAQSWTVAKRSAGQTGDYLILDTYGELTETYVVATVAIIGGGFSKLGGQNLIQPLALGIPVIHGPHMFNFRDSAEQSLRAGSSLQVEPTVDSLVSAVRTLLDDPEKRIEMGTRAKGLVNANVGASQRYAQAIVDALG